MHVFTAQQGLFLYTGAQQTAGATAAALPALPATLSQGVWVQASYSNTGVVYVGLSDVAANKCLVELSAGKERFIPVCDPTKLFVLGSLSGQLVNYGGV